MIILASFEYSPEIATTGLILLLVALTAAGIWIGERRRLKRLRIRLARDYGTVNAPDLSAEEFESISRFYLEENKDAFTIDDITWNDLGADDIYRKMQGTLSSPGDDVLMSMLRVPCMEETELLTRESVMRYFDSHEKERVDVQMLMAGIGRKRHMSQYEYLRYTEEAEPVNLAFYIALMLAAAASIVLLILMPMPGIFVFSALLAYDVHLNLKNNDTIRIYADGFNSLLRMIAASEKAAKLRIPELSPYTGPLSEYASTFRAFKRGSFLVTSSGTVSNGPAEIILDYIKMFFHFDMLKFNQMIHAVKRHRTEWTGMYRALGSLDALAAAASFRHSLPFYTEPVFAKEDGTPCGAELKIKKLYHPLISDPVTNSFEMRGGNLITGSNASGKSTFLKSCAAAAIMAQSIHTVPAAGYEAGFFKVMSSMALTDNLAAKESYFIVELKSIRRILAEAEKEGNLLCLIDEVLRGTNTVERIAASSRILASLKGEHILALAATHDGELTHILEKVYTNWHFEETVTEGEVLFDYRLKTGRAESRNAIRLLSVMGFAPEIVKDAEKEAKAFDETGVWERL